MNPKALVAAALRPHHALPARATTPQGTPKALLDMLSWRAPLGLLGALAAFRELRTGVEQFRQLEGPWAEVMLTAAPELTREDLQSALAQLPQLPSIRAVLAWLLLLVPLGLLGVWLHHSVWDHGCLWILRGLRKEQAWKATLEAEAVALEIGAVGAALGLLTLVPVVGAYLWPFLLLVNLWFWCLRGLALASFHGCPLWKGVVATLLHGFLVLLLGCGLLALLLLVIGLQV